VGFCEWCGDVGDVCDRVWKSPVARIGYVVCELHTCGTCGRRIHITWNPSGYCAECSKPRDVKIAEWTAQGREYFNALARTALYSGLPILPIQSYTLTEATVRNGHVENLRCIVCGQEFPGRFGDVTLRHEEDHVTEWIEDSGRVLPWLPQVDVPSEILADALVAAFAVLSRRYA
jgi:hypothetical protein